jgi:hypothetical protein
MGIEPTRSLFPNPSPVLKTGAGTSRTRTPVCAYEPFPSRSRFRLKTLAMSFHLSCGAVAPYFQVQNVKQTIDRFHRKTAVAIRESRQRGLIDSHSLSKGIPRFAAIPRATGYVLLYARNVAVSPPRWRPSGLITAPGWTTVDAGADRAGRRTEASGSARHLG